MSKGEVGRKDDCPADRSSKFLTSPRAVPARGKRLTSPPERDGVELDVDANIKAAGAAPGRPTIPPGRPTISANAGVNLKKSELY